MFSFASACWADNNQLSCDRPWIYGLSQGMDELINLLETDKVDYYEIIDNKIVVENNIISREVALYIDLTFYNELSGLQKGVFLRFDITFNEEDIYYQMGSGRVEMTLYGTEKSFSGFIYKLSDDQTIRLVKFVKSKLSYVPGEIYRSEKNYSQSMKIWMEEYLPFLKR